MTRKSRKKLGLPEFRENTWRAGLERMLLGYAMPGQGEKMFKGVLPYDKIEGGDAQALGNFAHLPNPFLLWQGNSTGPGP